MVNARDLVLAFSMFMDFRLALEGIKVKCLEMRCNNPVQKSKNLHYPHTGRKVHLKTVNLL